MTRRGDAKLVYKMIVGPSYPSYGYWIEHGMTTLCESFLEFDETALPNLVRVDGVGNLTSLNHHFWGGVSAWLYENIAGLKIVSDRSALIQPKLISALQHASARYGNGDAEIFVEWERTPDGVVLKVRAIGFSYALNLARGITVSKVSDTSRETVYFIGNAK